VITLTSLITLRSVHAVMKFNYLSDRYQAEYRSTPPRAGMQRNWEFQLGSRFVGWDLTALSVQSRYTVPYKSLKL